MMGDNMATETGDVVTARLHWQLGNWDALAAMPADPSLAGRPTSDAIETGIYKAQALFMTGAIEDGRTLIADLRRAGVERRVLMAGLLSGAYGNLARAWMILDHKPRADSAVSAAVALNPEGGEPETVSRLRSEREWQSIRESDVTARGGQAAPRKLFIDCGGYDGCSVLKFLLTRPEYDCVSFEPNPALWDHFRDLPTRLFRKAVYTYDGEIDLKVDPVDGDGSTLVAGKRIDFTRTVPDDECPTITVPCMDLSRFISQMSERYDVIDLKLDVEGAEYAILERLVEDETIGLVNKLYCEFHGHKMDIEDGRHERIYNDVGNFVEIDDWDALPFSFSQEESRNMRRETRRTIIEAIACKKTEFRERA